MWQIRQTISAAVLSRSTRGRRGKVDVQEVHVVDVPPLLLSKPSTFVYLHLFVNRYMYLNVHEMRGVSQNTYT